MTHARLERLLALSLIAVFCLGSAPSASAGDKKARTSGKTVQLVWPLPPEKPRIRFVDVIRGAFDVEPVKKQRFLDKIAGIQNKDFKPAFAKPYGVATDSKGRIYVADSSQSVVFVLDREHRKVTYLGRSAQVHLRVPIGITVDGKDRIWVADAVGQHVYAFDADNNVLMALGSADELKNPTSVAVDDDRHRVYVADSQRHCIVVYDSETGEFLKKFGQRGTEHGEFNFPTNITLSRAGNLYVSDTMNFRVQVFDPDGKFLSSFGSQGNKPGQFAKPKGIAVDDQENAFVVDSDFDNIQIFDKQNFLLMPFGGYGRDAGAFWLPAAIYIDRNKNIYISDQNNARIQIFKLLDNTTDDAARSVLKAQKSEEMQDPTKSH